MYFYPEMFLIRDEQLVSYMTNCTSTARCSDSIHFLCKYKKIESLASL